MKSLSKMNIDAFQNPTLKEVLRKMIEASADAAYFKEYNEKENNFVLNTFWSGVEAHLVEKGFYPDVQAANKVDHTINEKENRIDTLDEKGNVVGSYPFMVFPVLCQMYGDMTSVIEELNVSGRKRADVLNDKFGVLWDEVYAELVRLGYGDTSKEDLTFAGGRFLRLDDKIDTFFGKALSKFLGGKF